MYASAVKNAVATYQLKDGKAPTTFEDLEEYITYDGTEVECETSELNNDGSIYLEECKVGNTLVEGYTYGEKETVSYKKYNNGDVVYFNVTTGESCTDYTESQSASGINSGCMKFYAFNDSETSDTVNLLLDHNTQQIAVWDQNGSNVNGPTTLLEKLQSNTESWVGTETPTNYSLDQSSATSGANYTIDYSGYKARIISAEEIAQITGNTSWDVTSDSASSYYFDSLTTTASDTCKSEDTSGCSYGWLYDRTYSSCTNYGCDNNLETGLYTSGYWTVSASALSSSDALYVNYTGSLGRTQVIFGGSYGVRPVIEVLKSKLS